MEPLEHGDGNASLSLEVQPRLRAEVIVPDIGAPRAEKSERGEPSETRGSKQRGEHVRILSRQGDRRGPDRMAREIRMEDQTCSRSALRVANARGGLYR